MILLLKDTNHQVCVFNIFPHSLPALLFWYVHKVTILFLLLEPQPRVINPNRKRKSKWHPEPAPMLPYSGQVKWVPESVTPDVADLLVCMYLILQLISNNNFCIVRIRIEEITRKLASGQLDIDYSDDR